MSPPMLIPQIIFIPVEKEFCDQYDKVTHK